MRIMQRLCLLFLALVMGCTNDPRIATDTSEVKKTAVRGMGVLVGRVTMGLLPPIPGVRPDRPGPIPGGRSAPVTGAKILISELDGQQVRSVVTDDHGVYSISLPPGTYRIEMPPLAGGRFTRSLPANVTITEAKETRLDIFIDTGIR